MNALKADLSLVGTASHSASDMLFTRSAMRSASATFVSWRARPRGRGRERGCVARSMVSSAPPAVDDARRREADDALCTRQIPDTRLSIFLYKSTKCV